MNFLDNFKNKNENFALKFDNSFNSCDCQIKFNKSTWTFFNSEFFKENPKFTNEHLLQPSSFPNGSVCGHLREIRSINFAPTNNNTKHRKINIKPVNLKIKTS